MYFDDRILTITKYSLMIVLKVHVLVVLVSVETKLFVDYKYIY